MSKAVQEKVNQLFEAVKDLTSYDEIKPYCEEFNEWLNTEVNYSKSSLGTVLSRTGFHKKFKSIPLVQGQNAELVPKHDGQGNVKGHELKHYVLLLCGLDDSDWQERNKSEKVIGRLGNSQELNPDEYLELTGKLLESLDPHELAVGLIAATGRRPHEILARAKFTPIDGQSYQVMFEGQGKKRGDKPVFQIATLYPASYIIERLNHLRKSPTTRGLLTDIANEFPRDIAAQNRSIDSRRNGSLNRVVRQYFGDKGNNNPVLNFRHGEEQDNCKALRAAYLALATERDCQGSMGAKMLHAAKLAGHFTNENPNDGDLNHLVTTLGYADYVVTNTVNFPDAPTKDKLSKISVLESNLEEIREIQKQHNLPNQQSVISHLVESYLNRLDTAKELVEARKLITELQIENTKLNQDNRNMQTQITELQSENLQLQQKEIKMLSTELEAENSTVSLIEVQAMLLPLVKRIEALEAGQVTQAIKPVQAVKVEVKEDIDWQAVSNAELWNNADGKTNRAKGASEEKIRRCYEAICLYNNTVATGDNDRLAITNQALRTLSGVNGLAIGEWIKAHSDEIISHHSKYGMENPKDASKVETYYNKRHGAEKIADILGLINTELLEGEAMKSQS